MNILGKKLNNIKFIKCYILVTSFFFGSLGLKNFLHLLGQSITSLELFVGTLISFVKGYTKISFLKWCFQCNYKYVSLDR